MIKLGIGIVGADGEGHLICFMLKRGLPGGNYSGDHREG